jgi:hypothetical protein
MPLPKILRDIALESLRAGTKEALRKLDDAVSAPSPPKSEPKPERIKVEVICKGCGETILYGESKCASCGRPGAAS